ncbi:unnamed protein product [Soboliphyme baturini]|uniref:Thyroglobulin type-1 domain-containing protein n=1 Tax=Soboliphyme baturini TaxID=241478 RepID=A0A183IN93_9BILA|nr:unnamed protein product [Soboliphyme baturini]
MTSSEIHMKVKSCDMMYLCTPEEIAINPLCGTDGRTYNSLCEVKKVSCHGSPVQVPTVIFADNAKCRLERAFQQNIASKRNGSAIFIPECEPDGTYSVVQCHRSTGYCWCVTNNGKPIPGTSVRQRKPKCSPQGESKRVFHDSCVVRL